MPSKAWGKPAAGTDISPEAKQEAFSVFHIRRNAPEQIHIDIVTAPNESAARDIALKKFQDSTILRISGRDAPARGNGYPSARFIHGEFRAATPTDDWVLGDLNE